MRRSIFLLFLLLPFLEQTADAAENSHVEWNKLLQRHVMPFNGGVATAVDYQGMARDRDKLKLYLHALSTVTTAEFDALGKHDQLAFLINAYNAWTVELILTQWPDLKSIKDLGGFFSSPWSREFVALLGKTRTLDDIEHKLIRGSGRYNDPRIHFALNCASIGCPALRAEAYVGSRLDQQLNEQTALFLGDRNRNRAESDSIKLSSIFKWYREDFEKGWQGFNRLEDFLLVYADALELSKAQAKQLKSGAADIEFLDYDWRLNKK